ncbi:hypothetical protein LEN26_019691 [Aphanomyces euteiches]|nr:hypothetical protein LEN26_019691 [Aphanomyces euteiches]
MRFQAVLVAVAAVFLGVAADDDTNQDCIDYNRTYQKAVDSCRAAVVGKTDDAGNPIWLPSQKAFCNITQCAAAVNASSDRQAKVRANSACKQIEVTAIPGTYCTDACVIAVANYSTKRSECYIAQNASIEKYCHSCEDVFSSHLTLNMVCSVNSASNTSYITTDRNDFQTMLSFCTNKFPNVQFTFPADPNVVETPASKTGTYIGIGAGVVVVILLVVGVIMYRRRQANHKNMLSTTAGGSGRYYSNNRTPNSRNGTNGPMNTLGGVVDDIRFDPELARFRIPQEQIQNVTLLVKGGYGVVFKATYKGIQVAMKQLLPSKAKDQHAIQEFMNEIRLCARLDHPKIVGFVGISWSTLHDLAVLSEFMPHGDVTDLLKAERKKPAKERVFHWESTKLFATSKTLVAADVADALTFLHSFEPTIIHRDLKSKNVLMAENWEAKLSDFGISRVTSNDDTMTSNIGTVAWIAPEVLTGGRYSEKADIYSFGVFLSELDTLESPYAEMNEKNAGGFSNARIAMMVSEGALQPSFTDTIPSPILELARKCLSYHDVNRPSAKQIAEALRSLA